MPCPRVSVILAAYNHERFVGKAIESVLNQTFGDFELLIADDGSPDDTAKVIRSFCDPRIQAFYFPNNGHQHTRNYCIERARGEYIAIQNSDDVHHPAKLEKQIRVLDESPQTGAVFSWLRVIGEDDNVFPDPTHPGHAWFNQPNRNRFEWLRHFFEEGNHLCHPTVLMRRSVLEEAGLYSPTLALTPDFDLWVRIASRHELHVIPEPLADVRVLDGEANASGRRPSVLRRGIYEHTKVLRHFASQNVIKDLGEIFPNLATRIAGKNMNARRYILAEHALERSDESHRLFGLDLLHGLLSEPDVEKELRTELGPEVVKTFLLQTAQASPIGHFEFASARVFWPINGLHSHANSKDAVVPWHQRTTIVLSNIPARAGDQLIVSPLDCKGIVRLNRITLRSEKSRQAIAEYIFPRDRTALTSREHAMFLENGDPDSTLLLCASGEAQWLLPPLAECDGSLRVELEMEASQDWHPLVAAWRKAESESQSQIVRAAKRLRASLVKTFSRRNSSRT